MSGFALSVGRGGVSVSDYTVGKINDLGETNTTSKSPTGGLSSLADMRCKLTSAEREIERLTSENNEFRLLLRMVLANLKNPSLGGISEDQIWAIDEALDFPFGDD